MKIIGITGGIGAGKSTLLSLTDMLDDTFTVQADLVARDAMVKGGMAYEKTVFMFGSGILSPDGEIDRKKLADIVFKEDNKRLVLNSIVHPIVKNLILEDIQKKDAEGKKIYFIEAALLLEDHYDRFCDEIWYIYADAPLRRERLKASRGYTDEKIDDIFSSQITDEKIKKKYLTKEEPFGNVMLDACEYVKRYSGKPPWTVFDNNTGFLLTIDIFDILNELTAFDIAHQ